MSNWYSLSTLPTDTILIGPDGLEHAFMGNCWPLTRTPIWTGGNLVQEGANGRESRATCRTQPRYRFTLRYDEGSDGYLPTADMQALMALFNQCRGNVYALTLVWPDDCYVENQQIGVGDGGTKAFTLCRTWGSVLYTPEPAWGSTEDPFSYIRNDYGFSDTGFKAFGLLEFCIDGEGVDSDDRSFVATTGVVTFDTAPADGAIITATFHYAWRVRFETDEYDFDNFASGFYSVGDLAFITVGKDE